MYNENNVCTVGEKYPDDQLHLMESVNPVDTLLFLEGSEAEKDVKLRTTLCLY